VDGSEHCGIVNAFSEQKWLLQLRCNATKDTPIIILPKFLYTPMGGIIAAQISKL